MKGATAGIHHITAIAGDAQKNLDFYSGVLGLRLVKKTVNHDDPETYHFYFGDRIGTPGTVLTFFPWTSSGLRGLGGPGQVTGIAFSIPRGSLGFWQKRLEQLHVEQARSETRGDETQIAFHDPDGLALQLVESGDQPSGKGWDRLIPGEDAIRGFHSATLSVRKTEATTEFLSSVLGLSAVSEHSGTLRFAAHAAGIGSTVDVVPGPSEREGQMGVGAVHHIAWRARDDEEQRTLRDAVTATGAPATPVIDRVYFRSVYFHEPGGVLFEIATDPPGFTRDEPEESLGTSLKLPPWLEKLRPSLEMALPAVHSGIAVEGSETWTPAR